MSKIVLLRFLLIRMRVQLKNQKIQKVFFIEKDIQRSGQLESIAKRYMNCFTIDENDQFEIASIQTIDKYDPIAVDKVIVKEFKIKIMEAVENLTKQQKQGKDYF